MQGVALTIQDKEKFLQKLHSSAGNVSKAAKAIKISRNVAYEHKKKDTDFAAAWDEVIEAVADEMEQELYRRAVKGTLKPIFYKGQLVTKVREYSDRLLEFGLKGKRPEIYRERLDLNAHHTGTLDPNIQFTIDKIYADGEQPTDPEIASAAIDAGSDPDSEE